MNELPLSVGYNHR